MDEMQRKAIYEGLQKHDRNEWLKLVGLKPQDTLPLPQLISAGKPEEASQEPAKDEEADYTLEAEQAEQKEFDNQFGQQEQPESPERESLPKYEGQEEAAPRDFWFDQSQPEQPKQDVGVRYEVRKKEPQPEAMDKPKAEEPKQEPPEEKKDQAQQPAQQAQQQPQQADAKPDAAPEPKRRLLHETRAAIIKKAKEDFAKNRAKGSRFGDLPWGRTHGGNTPDQAGNADAAGNDGAFNKFADSGSHFAASVAAALERLTLAMNDATARIRELERVLDDGAS